MWSSVVNRLSLFVVAALLGLSGCTVALDYGLEGHVCGPKGECQKDYSCNAANVCVKTALTECSPACGDFEKCDRQRCVPSCEDKKTGTDKACPSGMQCLELEGSCSVVDSAKGVGDQEKLGALCTADADCGNVLSPGSRKLYCLIPFGGHASGVCSAECGTDADCGSFAPTCKKFRSEKGEESLSLCSADSFVPCTTDAVCAASGLVCGVYEFGSTPGGIANIRSASACRVPIGTSDRAVAVTVQCQADANPCVNGLCILTSNAGFGICTQQCTVATDCPTGTFSACGQATVGGRILDFNYPYVRTQVCLPSTGSRGVPCDPGTTQTCKADAPYCVRQKVTSPTVCAERCTNGTEAGGQRCPGGFECKDVVDGTVTGSYCFKTEE